MEPSHAMMEDIADEHFAFIARYLARLGVRAQDVEDVAQEVLAGAYRALPRYDPSRGSVRSWLMGIATHQASNHFRRAHRRRERLRSLDELAAVPDATPDSEQRVIARDRRCVLDQLLEEVPLERRFVFVAHEIEGLDMAEIAEQLAIPLSTAWSRHRLAWADLNAAMRRWQARQRGRGLAVVPISVSALVHEARADREVGRSLLARLWRWIIEALSPRRLAITGGVASSAGVASALNTAAGAAITLAGVALTLAGAALAVALVLGALRDAPSPAPDDQATATPSAGAALPPGAAPSAGAALPPGAAPSAGAALLPGAALAADAPPDGGRAAAAGAGAGASRADGAAPPAQRPATQRAGRAPSPPSPAAATHRKLASDDREMAAERALIDGAILALSNDRYAEADSLLVAHERRFPAGRLTAERNATLRALRARAAR
ncbi:RNA polymerase sigma factor [Sorangium sp. So ce1036]|uniref:RNA polymerase sigma factor n=1 Tax=Sorangium sp. So ce1036 TaxID=3133328 RepID=UPI003F0E4C46